MSLDPHWIVPDWPAGPRVQAFVTTRHGGVSEGEYGTMNLGMSSGDDPGKVTRNREIVRAALPGEPRYMKQVHGTTVMTLSPALSQRRGSDFQNSPSPLGEVRGEGHDAFITSTPATVATVLTADCMPLFLASKTRVAAVHAGWRGMAAGVIENAVSAFEADPHQVHAWMGPTIGPESFEVGEDVLQAFTAVDPRAGEAFEPRETPGKYLADLYRLARMRLARAGVDSIHGGGFCTFRDKERFFSYRRMKQSGRMGAFIWIEP
jgi:YfiH family protein